MHPLLTVLGIIWASPLSLLGLLHVIPMQVIGKYRFWSRSSGALVWTYVERSSTRFDRLLGRLWHGWAGTTSGNIIIIKGLGLERNTRTLKHEHEHVSQAMHLGPMLPIIYAINYVIGRWVLKNTSGYYDNIFEISARRAAGEVIDVVGVSERLKSAAAKDRQDS